MSFRFVVGERLLCTFAGHASIKQSECEQRECCWKESTVKGEPWCFYKPQATPAPTAHPTFNPPTCKIHPDTRRDCGTKIETVCAAMGCCWQELQGHPPNFNIVEPRCFHPELPRCNMPVGAREECGYVGMKEPECEAKGCCWSPTEDLS